MRIENLTAKTRKLKSLWTMEIAEDIVNIQSIGDELGELLMHEFTKMIHVEEIFIKENEFKI